MGHDYDRRRRERYDRLERYIEETEEDLAGSGDLGTFEDLLVEDTFATESGTLSITDEDLPIETGANPLPSPWQGIRRVGMVLNFNFIWDEEAGEWVRQKKSDLGSPSEGDLVEDNVLVIRDFLIIGADSLVSSVSTDIDILDANSAESEITSSVSLSTA